MKYATIFTLTLALTPGCSTIKSLVQDLDIPKRLEAQTCKLYTQKARGQAEYAWQSDWPAFAPMFEAPATPEQDEATCRDMLGQLGVRIEPMPGGRSGGMAVCHVAFFEPEFEDWNPVNRAATMCHELAHILAQQREGCAYWLSNYATVSGRLAGEGTAYALSDAIFERHGWSERKIAGAQARRARRFPASYKLERLVQPECVSDYFGRLRAALKERSGH